MSADVEEGQRGQRLEQESRRCSLHMRVVLIYHFEGNQRHWYEEDKIVEKLCHPVGCYTLPLTLLVMLSLGLKVSHCPDQDDRVKDSPREGDTANYLPADLHPEGHVVTHCQQDTDHG